MGLFSVAKLFGMTIRESATDGSDFTNPDADYRRLFLGEDGALHLKDSAGAVTAVGGTSGGALVLLEQHTASNSASLDFTTFISSTYDEYMIEGVDVLLATNAADLYLEIGTGGGPTYDTGNNYEWSSNGYTTGGAGYNDAGSTGVAKLLKSVTNNSGYGAGQFSLRATGLQSTSIRKSFYGTMHMVTSAPASANGTVGVQWTTTGTAATALRFIASSGDIASGTIRIYGIAKA